MATPRREHSRGGGKKGEIAKHHVVLFYVYPLGEGRGGKRTGLLALLELVGREGERGEGNHRRFSPLLTLLRWSVKRTCLREKKEKEGRPLNWSCFRTARSRWIGVDKNEAYPLSSLR